MLSVTAADILAIADPASLKHPPTSLQSCTVLPDNVSATAWATDNSALYLASARTISRYDPSSNQLKILYTLEDRYYPRCLVWKGKSSLIFCSGDKIHVLECGDSPTIAAQAFASHKRDILSLSLSNDSTLLASASADNIYIHNIARGSHTVLRGLPPAESITVCAFHPHTRTRLLVCAGKQLFVYDITRTSSPMKTVPINEPGSGEITAVACSPFSKTLVATATSTGYVGLIDLEKEKGLFRTLNMKVPLSVIAFSPEGAAIYIGTEDGKLLVVDLRALDKPPKSIIVSNTGNKVDTISIQGKLKNPSEDMKVKGISGVVSRTSAGASPSKIPPSPMRSRALLPSTTATPISKAFKAPRTGTPRQSPATKNANTNAKKPLSPARDSLANNKILNTRGPSSVKASNPKSTPSTSSERKHGGSSMKAASISAPTRRSSSTRTHKSSTAVESADPSTTTQAGMNSEALPSTSNGRTRFGSRTASSASLAPSSSSRSPRTASSASSSSAAPRRKHDSSSPVPPVPPLPVGLTTGTYQTLATESHVQSRTPSPDLPAFNIDPMTPIPSKKKNPMAVLGLGTPEVKAWIKAGTNASNPARRTTSDGDSRGKTKSVGFKDDNNGFEEECRVEVIGPNDPESPEPERERSLSMQISPHRLIPTSSSDQSQGQRHRNSQSWEASPRRPHHAAHIPGTPTLGSAHELLRTIVKDVMYDFQRETKTEMMGLHLDLVRMGRGWKQELRILMDEYVGDLNDLREENRRLREENERLRTR